MQALIEVLVRLCLVCPPAAFAFGFELGVGAVLVWREWRKGDEQ